MLGAGNTVANTCHVITIVASLLHARGLLCCCAAQHMTNARPSQPCKSAHVWPMQLTCCPHSSRTIYAAWSVQLVCAVQAFNTLLNVFAKHCSWGAAWSVMQAIRRAGKAPDVHSYNTLLDACKRCDVAAHWARICVSATMRWHAHALPESDACARLICVRIRPLFSSVFAYPPLRATNGHAIACFTMSVFDHVSVCRAGQWDRVIEVYHTMLDEGGRGGVQPDRVTFNTVISAAKQALKSVHPMQLREDALDVYETMLDAGIEPDTVRDASCAESSHQLVKVSITLMLFLCLIQTRTSLLPMCLGCGVLPSQHAFPSRVHCVH